MKKLYRILIFTALVLIVPCSCSEDFLTVNPKHSIDLESFYSNPTDAEIGLIGAYSRIISKHMMYNIFYWMVSADEVTAANHANSGMGSGDHRDLADANLYGMVGTYTEPYVGIANLNLLLKKVPSIPETSFAPGRKKEILGEAYFLRAWAYYMLSMAFRDVPLVLEVPVSTAPEDNYLGSSSQAAILSQVMLDLDSAIFYLPGRMANMSDHDERGRAGKWAARAIKARIYLWNEDWAGAYNECQEILDHGHFKLTPRWTDIFYGENDNEEVIWQSQGQSRQDYDFMGVYRWYCDDAAAAPLPPFMVEKSMTSMFDQPYADVRLEYSVRAIGRSGGNYGGRNVKHFHVPSGLIIEGVTDESRDKNFPFIRLAEVLLMKAEAIVQSGYTLGSTADVLEILNDLRNRAADPDFVPREEDSRYPGSGGCTGIPLLTEGQVNLQAVKDEKRRELMCEGIRWLDLLRWGREDDYASLMIMVTADSPDRLYQAIPQSQIDANHGVLKQNIGYD